jgi:hypothetical protein
MYYHISKRTLGLLIMPALAFLLCKAGKMGLP